MRLHFVIGLTIGLGLALSGCDTTGLDDPGTCYSCSGGDHTGGGTAGGGTTGGDTTGGGTTGGDTTGGGTSNATFIPVNPRQTYLRTIKDNALDAPAVRLSDFNAEPGEQVCGFAVGDFNTGGGVLASSTGSPLITAVFSSDDRLLSADHLDRVPGAINVDPDVVTPVTSVDQYTTDIAEDFDATNTCVTIPAGATHVFFSAFDGFYADNASTSGPTFGIQIK